MVSTLLDTVRRGWDVAKVRNTFTPHEAEAVLSIPISVGLPTDSLLWAGTLNGIFTVKSAYMVAQKVLQENTQRVEEGGCSDDSGMKTIWKIVWRLNCPNKIKHLLWRACKNILPTKLRLKSRGVGEDDRCDMCGLRESSGHALWSCQVATAVWSCTKLKFPCFRDPPGEFIDFVWALKDNCTVFNWELFAITTWSLWNNRNNVRHGSKCKSHEVIAKEAVEYWKEVQKADHPQETFPASDGPPWKPPKQGWYKVNTDGAIFEDVRCCGIGVVIRNERGQLMGAMSKKVELPLGVMETEAKAVEEGVLLAWDLGLTEIIVETDAQQVALSLRSQCESACSIRNIIEGIRMGLRCFRAWEVSHTRKSGNCAAHIMARQAKLLNECNIWVEETPPMIADQVQTDVAHCLLS